MPARLCAVLGTDTGCGKTTLTAALAGALRRRGRSVAALKPLASGVLPGEPGDDALLLAAATGASAKDCVLHAWQLPRSPLSAARAEGIRIDVGALVEAIRARAAASQASLLLVEGVGGVLVPITEQKTVRDLVRELAAPVLLSARAGLGTLNHTALSVEACRAAGLDVVGVVLVDVDPNTEPGLALENAAQIAVQCDVSVLGILPHVDDPRDREALTIAAASALDLDGFETALTALGACSEPIVALDRAHLWHPFTQTTEWHKEEPLVVRSALGCRLRTADGREYLDGIGALWANVHGYAHPGIDRAIREQLGRVAHTTLLGQTHEQATLLAAELAAVAPKPLGRVFLSESGASAVEVALRVAILAQQRRGHPGRTRFLSLEEAYHGDTAGSVSVGHSEPFHRGLDPLLFQALRVPPPHLFRVREGLDEDAADRASLAALEGMLAEHGQSIAALVVEPRVQGAAGIWPHSDAWLRSAVELVRAAGALVVCDEVATGFGRTGDLFASVGAGIQPDVLCLGKGLSGGYLPVSATLVGDALFDLFSADYAEHRTLYYGHTFSGNPLACAAARASLAAFTAEATLERGRALAARLAERLSGIAALPAVAEVRQRGVMCGIELCADGLRHPFPPQWRVGRRTILAARRRGLVVRPLGDVVVLNPALVMSAKECDAAIDILAAAIEEVAASLPQPAGNRAITPSV